jgi:hypothetical protein
MKLLALPLLAATTLVSPARERVGPTFGAFCTNAHSRAAAALRAPAKSTSPSCSTAPGGGSNRSRVSPAQEKIPARPGYLFM